MNTEEDDVRIQKYLDGQTTPEETAAIERSMEGDIRFRESVLLEKQLRDTFDEQSWSAAKNVDGAKVNAYVKELRSDDTLALKETLKTLSQKAPSSKTNSKSSMWFLTLAAAVVAIVVTSTLLTGSPSAQDLYASYYTPDELPSLAVRSSQSPQQLVAAQEAFENKNYDQTITLLDTSILETTKSSTPYLYKAFAYAQSNKYTEAIATLETLEQKDILDASKGTWYKAIVHLKNGNKKAAITALKQVKRDTGNYNYTKATELLNELE